MKTYLQTKTVFTPLLGACRLPLVFLLLAMGSLVNAQAPFGKGWDRTLGSQLNDRLYIQVATADGGYLLGGSSNSNTGGDKYEDSKGGFDYWVVKIDANGNTAWNWTLGGAYEDQLTSILPTADGGFLLGGYSNSNTGGDKSDDSKGNYDYWLVKLQACPMVHLTASSPTLTCAVASITLTASADSEPTTYLWNTGATTPSITVKKAGEYSVKISTLQGCSTTLSQSINKDSTLTTSLTASGPLSCVNPSVTLTASPGQSFTYVFSQGATQINGGNTATVSQAGTYSVVVSSPGGCTASASVAVSGNPTTNPHPDYQPLADLYNSANGAHWTNQTGWLSTCDPCSWYGVSCSQGRVTGLDLHDNGLQGSLPESLGQLASLQQLALNSNQLSGSIPASLGNLTSLQALYLQSNQLTGPIPASLGGLTSLQQLLLNKNQLTGSLPQSLGGLTNLYSLYLDDNQLSGSIPASLGSLTSLKELYLFNNQLSGSIPASLGSLTKLQALGLNNNQLSGCYPASLTALCGIAYKDFSANAGLPGGGSAQALAAFCASGQGGDGFVASLTASGELSCVNPSVTLTATPTSGYSYVFSGGATQINGGNTASVTQAGSYSVVVSSPSGCSASAVVSVSATTQDCSPPTPVASIKSQPISAGSATGIISLTASSGGYTPNTSVSVSYVTPTSTTAIYTGSTTQTGEILIDGLTAGSYGPFVVSTNGGQASAPSNVVTLVDPTPDLTPLMYARPSTINGTSPITLVIDLLNLNPSSTDGLITLKISRDARVSLGFNATATQVGSRRVQNDQWQFSDADPHYYVLTTSAVIVGEGVLSVGLEGELNPGGTAGQLTLSAVVLGGGDDRLINNGTANKIDYFQD